MQLRLPMCATWSARFVTVIFKRVVEKQIQVVNINDGQHRSECEAVIKYGREDIDMKW